MGLFGWSLPPGCSNLPGEEPTPPCELCGGDPEREGEGGCICPECPYCGECGDPHCYSDRCGLKRSPAQDLQLAYFETLWALSAEREAAYDITPEYDSEDRVIVKPDNTPPDIKAAVAEAEQCIQTLTRAFSANIKPVLTAAKLVELANEIEQLTEKWNPTLNAS